MMNRKEIKQLLNQIAANTEYTKAMMRGDSRLTSFWFGYTSGLELTTRLLESVLANLPAEEQDES